MCFFMFILFYQTVFFISIQGTFTNRQTKRTYLPSPLLLHRCFTPKKVTGKKRLRHLCHRSRFRLLRVDVFVLWQRGGDTKLSPGWIFSNVASKLVNHMDGSEIRRKNSLSHYLRWFYTASQVVDWDF